MPTFAEITNQTKRLMTKFKNGMPQYVARVFKERLAELGMSQYQFINQHTEFANRITLSRILRGENTSISTAAHYAEKLGLEIKIVKKNENEEV